MGDKPNASSVEADNEKMKEAVANAAAEGDAKVLDAEERVKRQDSFARTFYDKINEVIGGNNPNEKLCLLLPGIALNKADYEYDYAHNAEKGPVVSANESRLANKLYDPYDLVGSDNGKMLDRQYRSALNLLSPRLNSIIVNAKNDLRRFLMTEFPYSFDGEDEKTYTFQEVYFRLYQDYIDAMKAWADEQSEKKDEISKRVKNKWARISGQGGDDYSEDDMSDSDFVNVVLPEDETERANFIMSETNREINNEYLSWYEINAESRLAEVNKKMSAVLSVFSANDMKVLEGILDCGSGAELQEAREMLNNTRKRNPNGGYVYPVSFSPSNWFEYLDTSFTPMDLLNNPEAYLNELDVLYSRRISLESQIQSISKRIPRDDELDKLKGEYIGKKTALSAAEAKLAAKGAEGVTSFVKTLTTTVCSFIGNKAAATKVMANVAASKKASAEKNGGSAGTLVDQISQGINGVADKLFEGGKSVNEAQNAVMAALDAYSTAALEYVRKNNMTQLENFLVPIRAQKEELDRKIETLESKLALAYSACSNDTIEYDEKGNEIVKKNSISVDPPEVPNGFSQITIVSSYQESKGTETSTTAITREHSQAGFWVFKKQNTKTNEASAFEQFCESEGTEIHIGMNVAKVGIERTWFDPGVFTLTKEMYSLGKQDEGIAEELKLAGTLSVSEGNLKNLSGTDDEEKLAHCVLPCYSTAMVIARDVTIKIARKANASNNVAISQSESDETSKGFFVFNSSSGSSSESNGSSYCSFTSDNCVTMKFASPQVIGFYLQYVEKDESLPYPSDESDLRTIGGFVSSYLKLIEDMKTIRAKLNK